MKLISLNIWGGKLDAALIDFLERTRDEVDIFCFQEVFDDRRPIRSERLGVLNIQSVLTETLSSHAPYYSESFTLAEEGGAVPYGLSMFVKKGVEIRIQGAYEIFKDDRGLDLPDGIALWNRLLQYAELSSKGVNFTVFNMHGIYTGGGKADDEARVTQSNKVVSFMNGHHGPKILCGDFNLNPGTESLRILEAGMRNLIDENDIASTRNSHFAGEDRLGDYVLVSPGIEVIGFEALPDDVSDHLPLSLEFKREAP